MPHHPVIDMTVYVVDRESLPERFKALMLLAEVLRNEGAIEEAIDVIYKAEKTIQYVPLSFPI
jgi:hypothetical protein